MWYVGLHFRRAVCREWARAGVIGLALTVAGCGTQAPTKAYHFTGPTMGTFYSVKVLPLAPGEDRSAELAAVIQEQLDRVNGEMSTYLPDSELSRFNRSGETTPFALSDDTFRVFTMAASISEATDGAFDVTVGPLVNAWGFGPEGIATQPPSEEDLAALHQRIGYQNLELDTAKKTVRKDQSDMYCDLSAIAKGFGVDQVFNAVTALGYQDLMVEVGGEVRAQGHNERGQPWQIAIEKPVSEGRSVERVIALDGLAIATSGDYRNYVEQDGVRLSHIIDPRTNRPIAHKLASASVLSKECALADGYATAMMVLGSQEGYEMAVREDLAVLFIVREADGSFVEKTTPAFERLTQPVVGAP